MTVCQYCSSPLGSTIPPPYLRASCPRRPPQRRTRPHRRAGEARLPRFAARAAERERCAATRQTLRAALSRAQPQVRASERACVCAREGAHARTHARTDTQTDTHAHTLARTTHTYAHALTDAHTHLQINAHPDTSAHTQRNTTNAHNRTSDCTVSNGTHHQLSFWERPRSSARRRPSYD